VTAQIELKRRIDVRNEQFVERITAALKRNYFSNSPPDYLESAEGKKDLLDHVIFRYQMFADFYVPWLLSRYDLSPMRIVEIGSGTGCSTLAFAPVVKSIDCYELSVGSTEVAKERLGFWAIENVTFHPELFDARVAKHREGGKLDAVLLCACLEHMTHEECLTVLSICWKMIRPGGILIVAETPNRFSMIDEHSSWLPLFSMLPREIQIAYAGRSPREGFRTVIANALKKGKGIEAMTRWGSGVSFHEFEIAIGNEVHDLITLNGYEPEMTSFFPVTKIDKMLQIVFQRFRIKANIAFTRRNLNFVVQKPAE